MKVHKEMLWEEEFWDRDRSAVQVVHFHAEDRQDHDASSGVGPVRPQQVGQLE